MDLERENLALKEKENLLAREVTKYVYYYSIIYFLRMQTKLRRIDELIKAGKNYTDGDFISLQNELED